MKILIYVESGDALSDGEFHRFKGEYDRIPAAIVGLKDLTDKYNKMIGEPDFNEADNEISREKTNNE